MLKNPFQHDLCCCCVASLCDSIDDVVCQQWIWIRRPILTTERTISLKYDLILFAKSSQLDRLMQRIEPVLNHRKLLQVVCFAELLNLQQFLNVEIQNTEVSNRFVRNERCNRRQTVEKRSFTFMTANVAPTTRIVDCTFKRKESQIKRKINKYNSLTNI